MSEGQPRMYWLGRTGSLPLPETEGNREVRVWIERDEAAETEDRD